MPPRQRLSQPRRSGVVQDIRAGEVDVRAGQVDFHVHVVRCPGRIDVKERFIVGVIYEPADTVGVDGVGCIDQTLNIGRARNGGQST